MGRSKGAKGWRGVKEQRGRGVKGDIIFELSN